VVRRPPLRRATHRAIAYLNVDLIGQQGAKHSAPATASLGGLAADVVRARTGAPPLRTSRPGRAGDQSFLGLGLPSLQLMRSRLRRTPARGGGTLRRHVRQDRLRGAEGRRRTCTSTPSRSWPRRPFPPIDASRRSQRSARSSRSGRAPRRASSISRTRCSARHACSTLLRTCSPASARSPAPAARRRRPRARHHPPPGAARRLHAERRLPPGRRRELRQLPGLAVRPSRSASSEDELRFTETTLRREQNRLVEALDQSIRKPGSCASVSRGSIAPGARMPPAARRDEHRPQRPAPPSGRRAPG
jgi:hypothetical protein